MRYYFIYFAALLTITLSCQTKSINDNFPELLDLVIIDSVLVEEPIFFMNGQSKVQLVGDSLIGVSSYKSPSVGFYHITGDQRKRIASGDYPIGSFSPSNYDASEYPIVFILDSKSESVLIFDVEKQELIEKIKLKLPEGKTISFLGANFKKLKDSFLVQLSSSINNLDPGYYKESGNLIYFFDEKGNEIKNSFLTYPEVIKNFDVSIGPINYLQATINGESMCFTFPHERIIRRFSLTNSNKLLEEIELPKSRFFDYQINSADQIYSFEDFRKSGELSSMKIPNSHQFNSIHETPTKIIIQSWLVGDESNGINRTSHLMVYGKEDEQWYETSNPRNILDIGMLAGVVNDTLFFYEGSLMKQDEKYIKRAVLKSIQE